MIFVDLDNCLACSYKIKQVSLENKNKNIIKNKTSSPNMYEDARSSLEQSQTCA